MNKSGLIEILSKEVKLTKKQVEEIVDIIFNAMTQSLISGKRVEIRGFGSFVMRDYPSYIGRNPKTGEAIKVPPKKLPFFKVGKYLKERVDHWVTPKSLHIRHHKESVYLLSNLGLPLLQKTLF